MSLAQVQGPILDSSPTERENFYGTLNGVIRNKLNMDEERKYKSKNTTLMVMGDIKSRVGKKETR